MDLILKVIYSDVEVLCQEQSQEKNNGQKFKRQLQTLIL